MLQEQNTSRDDRLQERGDLARTIAEHSDTEPLVLSRTTLASFGVNEWRLIEELDSTEPVVVPSTYQSAARRLAENGIVTLSEREDGTLVAEQDPDTIVARVL